MNQFLSSVMTKDARTWNGAVSNSTSGNKVLDYFAKCGSYRGRSSNEVAGDLAAVFGENTELGMKVVMYNRMITRRVDGFDGQTEQVQKGQGQRDEFIKSLAWLEVNSPKLLMKNLWMVPLVGRWSDLWYDSPVSKVYHYVNTDWVYELVSSGIHNDTHRALIAKNLPKIRSARNVKTDRHHRLNAWARGLCDFLGWTEKEYRKFKSNPENTAHNFQRILCDGNWSDLDFNLIPGKAMHKLSVQRGKDGKTFFERHGLAAKFEKWLDKQPVAKFTGFVYELKQAADKARTAVQKKVVDKQFTGLIELGKDSIPEEILAKGVLPVLDTSGSMTWSNYGPTKVTPLDICLSLGVYFSELIQGHFHNHVVMFSNHSRLLRLTGDSFTGKIQQIMSAGGAAGGTNFQSVIDELVKAKIQHPQIPVSDYPQVLLVVSDMQFNPADGYGHNSGYNTQTNYEVAMAKLAKVGLPKMSIIWWNVNGRFTNDFASTLYDEGTTLIGGFDGAIVSALLGKTEVEVVDKVTGKVTTRKATPMEQMLAALDQELLNRVSV